MDKRVELIDIHRHLIHLGFPYHSFSVFRMNNEEVNRVIFTDNVRDRVTDEVEAYIKAHDALFSFVGELIIKPLKPE